MIEAEADERARELNLQIGAEQASPSDYYVPVQAEDGTWDVEKRPLKGSLIGRIIDAS